MMGHYVQTARVSTFTLEDDGTFPNNPRLPLLVYQAAFDLPQDGDPAAVIEEVFAANHWGRGWRNGVYNQHHYHSTAHEVLGCYSGHARIQFGGPGGMEVEARCGDVIILPAGTTHKKISASADFRVVGCYPDGQDFDMNYGGPGERPAADEHIARVPLPAADPVYGDSGPLMDLWR